jgi:hypothetical protein
MEPVIHLRDAVVVLGRFPALAGASLEVARGEIVLLQDRTARARRRS